ncbi:MAG: SH3 domain-containing protein [Pseudomonadota bacterium]
MTTRRGRTAVKTRRRGWLVVACALMLGLAGGTASGGALVGAAGGGWAAAQAPLDLDTRAAALPGAGTAGSGPNDGPGGVVGYGVGPVTKLPMPRYVSLRASRINVRRGPGLNYRIDWVFQRSDLPVQIVGEFGDWRQIVDSDGATGWVYHALLTGRRTVLVTEAMADLRARPEDDARLRAQATEGVVADLRQCRRDWCEVETDEASGWLPKAAIWGVDALELWPR